MKKRIKKMRIYCLENGRIQLVKYNKKSNDIPKVCLNFRTLTEVLNDYPAIYSLTVYFLRVSVNCH